MKVAGELVLLAALFAVAVWLVFANDGWTLFLMVGVAAAVTLLAAEFISVIFFHSDVREFITITLVAVPWISMVVYQTRVLLERRRSQGPKSRDGV